MSLINAPKIGPLLDQTQERTCVTLFYRLLETLYSAIFDVKKLVVRGLYYLYVWQNFVNDF